MSLPYDRFLFLVNKNEVATVKTFMKYCSCCHWSCIISYPIPNIAPNITLIANDNALPIFKEVVLGYLTRSTYKIFYFFLYSAYLIPVPMKASKTVSNEETSNIANAY